MKQPLPLDRIRGLGTSAQGLSAGEVDDRRRRYGRNEIIETIGNPVAALARETARDPMLWFLVGTAVLYGLLGQYAEAATLLVALAPLIGLDGYLHRRTQASTRALRGMLHDTARVERDGVEIAIPVTDIVVGDLAVVNTSDPFPADGVVVAGEDLTVDESALTGEAYPVAKHPLVNEPTDGAAPLVEAEHWTFAGTRLLTGRARVRVVSIGQETLYGTIVHMATATGRERTPLQQAVARLVTTLLAVALALCALLAAVRLQQGYGWVDAVVSAATLAVAALPEEFPVVLTVFLGVGVYRMARRKVLVNRAVAVENVGRVTCICSDKTGTLTEGRLRVAQISPATGQTAADVLEVAAFASRRESGDPLDRAILEAAKASEEAVARENSDAIATFPFTESRRRETTIIHRAAGVTAYTKGSPETVLAMCAEPDPTVWTSRFAQLAAAGHKIIGCATRSLAEYAGVEPDRDYRFTGVIAIADPVRAGVADALAWSRAAGIRVLMVTGDHGATASAVAREIGLSDSPVVVTGEQLATDDDIARAVRGADVVARALPAQKLAIVRALQRAGEVVAVTGDGVNDVPALRAADVGIAMGERGARSAREASTIVLLNDDFRSIVAAIAEGRVLFENLRLSFQYLLMIHLPLVLTATFIPLVGFPVLYLPIHIVWIEALIHPTALLAFQRAGGLRPLRPRRRAAAGQLFSLGEWSLVLAVGGIIAAVVALTYDRSLAGGDAHARAMALAALITGSTAVMAVLSGLASRAARLLALLSLASLVILIEIPTLATLVHLRALHLDDWLLAIAGGGLAVVPAIAATLVRRSRSRPAPLPIAARARESLRPPERRPL